MEIFEKIKEEFIGKIIYVRNRSGEMVSTKITRIDVFCSKRNLDINVHSSEYIDSYTCFNLFLNTRSNIQLTSYLQKAFLSIEEYNQYYENH